MSSQWKSIECSYNGHGIEMYYWSCNKLKLTMFTAMNNDENQLICKSVWKLNKEMYLNSWTSWTRSLISIWCLISIICQLVYRKLNSYLIFCILEKKVKFNKRLKTHFFRTIKNKFKWNWDTCMLMLIIIIGKMIGWVAVGSQVLTWIKDWNVRNHVTEFPSAIQA